MTPPPYSMLHRTIVFFALAGFFVVVPWIGVAAESGVVVVGAGSFAAEPPPYVDEGRQGDTVAGTIARVLPIDESQAGKPVPTNQWWSRFLIEPFSCTLWTYPLAVRPEPQGLRVFFPKEWNEIGTDMHLGPGVGLRAMAPAAAGLEKRADIVLADFEKGSYAMGWKTEGAAFGKSPAAGALETQGPVEGFGGKFFANSFHGGDAATGKLVSPSFRIDRKKLNFLLGGGADAANLGARLLVGNQAVRTATARLNQEKPEPVSWDVAEFAGKTARIEIFDAGSGSWGHVIADDFVLTDREHAERGDENSLGFADMKALRWGDWSLSLRANGPGGAHVDFTLGRGMPFCWAEYEGLDAVVETFGGAELLDAAGKPAVFPYRGKALLLAFGDRRFALHLPAGALCEREASQVVVRFPKSGKSILSITPLPGTAGPGEFESAAFLPPRDTRISWDYEPERQSVSTRWEVVTDDPAAEVWQGWLPHHWNTPQPVEPRFETPEYTTPRGRLRMAKGRTFEWVFPFEGFCPVAPAPAGPPFDAARMRQYLEGYAALADRPPDTYWSGKQLLRLATAMNIAHECGHADLAETFRTRLRDSLANWFTYSPGEREFFFAEYPRWKALIGFRDSYGSHQFNDLHFHYGYFTVSSALLGLRDPDFLQEFGPMAELVAKSHANWDRNDQRFPFLRTFDIWEGHSNASGLGGPNGNNQESSSEAMQSWAGLFLLGTATGNDAMRAAGAMGHAMERTATMQYWLDFPAWKNGLAGSNWSPNYRHGTVGILFSAGQAFATFFSADPGWIYGIQWLPTNPMMDYLAREPEFFKSLWDRMWSERGTWLAAEAQRSGGNPPPSEIGAIEPPLANYLLGFQSGFDAAGAVATLDSLWKDQNPVSMDMNGVPFSYFQAHWNLAVGPRLWQWSASVPTAAVHGNLANGKTTWSAVNFSDAAVTVDFFEAGAKRGKLTVPARSMKSTDRLE